MLIAVRESLKHEGMLGKGDKILVAVSGGPDSIALLYVLYTLKNELGLKLFVGHLNHMIRPDAAKDAIFVKKLVKKLRIPVIIETVDVPQLAKSSKRSMEDAARLARYDFFTRAAEKTGANKIALAHTMDDQAETVLMRLLRGSGLLGLSGMPAKRDLGGIEIVRPFIKTSKKEILRFLSRRKISFRKDATNQQPVYLRNKIRLKLLPFIEKEFAPDVKRILADTAQNLRIDYEYLSKIAAKKFKQYARAADAGIRLSETFLKEDTAVQRMIIREAIKRVKGDLSSVTYGHWEDLNRLLKKNARWSMTLPGGLIVLRDKKNLVFSKNGVKVWNDLTDILCQLQIPGKTKIPGIKKSIYADFAKRTPDFKSKESKNKEYFDFGKLKLPLMVRFRRGKDKIKPLGMVHYKKLKKLFIDEKAPFENRNRIPLVISGGRIIWVCGVKRSDHAKVGTRAKKVLRLKFLQY